MTLHYVPAGVEAYAEGRSQLQITLKPNAKESSDHGQKYKKWYTSSKTIALLSASAKNGVYEPEQVDLILPIRGATFIKSTGLTKILANPIHKNFSKMPFEVSGIESIVDSGGFQLLRGNLEFVEPDELVASYNKDANIGMPLDLPVPASAEPFYWDAVSKLMKANDDYMLPKLSKSVDLALVSHGSTLARRKSRLDHLDRDDAKVIAIAGLGIKPAPGQDHLTTAIESFMYVITRFHKTARYFHVLGITSKFWIFVYALLDASGYVKSIGADSVSHRLSALSGDYETLDFNRINLKKDQQYSQSLPCNCPICYAIDDARILQYYVLLESHNLWVKVKQTQMLADMAKHYVAGHIKLAEVHQVLRLNLSINDFQTHIKYIEQIIAADKFKPRRTLTSSGSLFKARKVSTHPNKEKYDQIFQRYENFHKKKFL